MDNVHSSKKRYVACAVADLPPGRRRIVELDGRSVGVFNVGGQYYALHNRCPHVAGPLCLGPVAGTTLPTGDYQFVYGREGYILRCAWHGWEFDIETGRAVFDPKIRARTYPAAAENGEVVVYI
jgi:3-phenylpropionate/trans-cinnamate dioxygenase ferredoxin subunit